jgi:septal ring-binding cell division protein DamX
MIAIRTGAVVIAFVLAMSGCAPAEPVASARDSVTPDMDAERTPDTGVTLAPAPPALHRGPGALRTDGSAVVEGWSGPGGQPFEVALRTVEQRAGHARAFGTITMPTSLRGGAQDLSQYPCTSCHFGGRVVMQDERITDAHANIQAVHPAQLGAVCSTCHSPENVERLALKSSEHWTLDHAYRLCAQCHSPQATAWAGGMHGKRLDGWQGRRVVMGCADCHDPHNPVVEARIPFRAPVIGRNRGASP